MQYICLIYKSEAIGPHSGSEAFEPYIQDYQKFSQLVQKDGVFVSGDALQPTATATTVTNHGGKIETTDGPFAETKEQLGGYYLLDCKNLDEALKYAVQRVEVQELAQAFIKRLLSDKRYAITRARRS